MSNIKRELETNELLKADIGPFEEISDEWDQITIVIPKYGARITVASTKQSIRGLSAWRITGHDLVIVMTFKTLNSVKTKRRKGPKLLIGL